MAIGSRSIKPSIFADSIAIDRWVDTLMRIANERLRQRVASRWRSVSKRREEKRAMMYCLVWLWFYPRETMQTPICLVINRH